MHQASLLQMQSLRIFMAVARAGSMSGAASELGVSQSAVSQAVRNLEEDLGVPLLNRQHRPMTLTPAGLALRNRGGTLLEEALSLRGAVLEASKGVKPDIRIGVVDSFAGTCGTSLIRQLLRQVGQLTVRTGLTPYHTEALLRRDFDLVIATEPLDDIDGVSRQRIFSEQFLIITPRDVRTPVCSVADLGLLANELPIIRFNSASHSGALVDRCLRRSNLSIPRRLEVDTADTLTAMVAGGLGWALTTPLCLLQANVALDQVRKVILQDLPAHRSMYVLARENEFPQLMRQTYDSALYVVESEIIPRLRDIEGVMDIFKTEPWNQKNI